MTDKKPELLILAAGLGSRYGGLKQLEGLGPNGETLMEYSIFDAIKVGFGRIVFVINRQHEEIFRSQIFDKYRKKVNMGFVFQEIDQLPDRYQTAIKREKPWGTGHAVLTAKNAISGSFAVINSDDFYGFHAFSLMSEELKSMAADSIEFLLMGYKLSNTLSEHGKVSRGLCRVKNGYLASIREMTMISKTDGLITGMENGEGRTIKNDSIVSMNFWGFSPRIFDILETHFLSFLNDNKDVEKSEFFLNAPLDISIKEGEIRVKLLKTGEKWLGITYNEDKEMVKNGIKRFIENEIYPASLSF